MSGRKEVLVVRVQAANAATTASEEELQERFFGSSASTFASHLQAISFNKVSFYGTTDTRSFPGVRNGVYTVRIDTKLVFAATTREEVVAAIHEQLTFDFGAGWSDNLDHYFYILPPGTARRGSTSWIGTCVY